MPNNTQIKALDVRESLKLAWGDCYHYLIPKDATNPHEEVEVYNAWLEWFESGQMVNNPLFNITLGYTIRDGILPDDFAELDMKECQELYLAQGYEAVKELVEELEQDDDDE